MAFALNEIISSGIDFATGDTGPDRANPEAVNAAAAAFGITGHLREGGVQQFNLPKMKFMFGVQFVLTNAAQRFLSFRHPSYDQTKLSFVVRDCDLPSQTFETYTVNQYNRKRAYAGKVTYLPIKMTMYDLQDAAGFELYDTYRAFLYGDFYKKNGANWDFNQTLGTSTFEEQSESGGFIMDTFNNIIGSADTTVKNWGRCIANQGDLSESRFFQRIDILEFDNRYYTAHNIHNPIISAANLDTKSHESDGDPQLIELTFEYEGITNSDPLTGISAIGMPIELYALSLVAPSQLGKDGNFQSSLPLEESSDILDGAEDLVVDILENAAIGLVTDLISGNNPFSSGSGNETASAVEGQNASSSYLGEVANEALDAIGGLF